jgi:hypothetical protein
VFLTKGSLTEAVGVTMHVRVVLAQVSPEVCIQRHDRTVVDNLLIETVDNLLALRIVNHCRGCQFMQLPPPPFPTPHYIDILFEIADCYLMHVKSVAET